MAPGNVCAARLPTSDACKLNTWYCNARCVSKREEWVLATDIPGKVYAVTVMAKVRAHIIALETILVQARSTLAAALPNATWATDVSSFHREMRESRGGKRRSANAGVLDRVRRQKALFSLFNPEDEKRRRRRQAQNRKLLLLPL